MANLIDIFNAGGVKPTEVVGGKGFYTKEEEIYEGNKLQKKFISNVDYSDPTNFARFGSAEEYYKSAIGYINSEYPYDGGSTEKLKWVNSLNELEYYIFKNEYPRYAGSVELSGTQKIDVYAYGKDLTGDTKTIYNEGDKFRYDTYIDFEDGITFESWIKINDLSAPVDILTINAFSESSVTPNTYLPVEVLNISSSGGYFCVSDGERKYVLSQSVPQNEWHHYAFRINTGSIELFVDGQMAISQAASINTTKTRSIFTPLGLFILKIKRTEILPLNYGNTPAFTLGNKPAAPQNTGIVALDDTRLWNGFRSIEKIGRFWFTTIDGNDKLTAADPEPQEPSCIFYFKYNEGWNADKSSIVVDYSGRKNNGVIENIETYLCRNNISAFNASGIVQDVEIGDPIIQGVPLETHNWADNLNSYFAEKIADGREHDTLNEHQLYNKFPSWVLESEEDNEVKHFKQIIQILAVYFDDLYNKIGELSQYKHEKLETESDKTYPFYDKILTSTGFDVTDLFTNLSIVEKASSRDDLNLFDESLEKVKNKIYQNIYNNLSYILKSKGTEKSIKSLLHTYGVGDNLVKVNLYGDKQVYNVSDRSEERIVKKKTIDLGQTNSVLLETDGAIPGSSKGGAFTYEAQFIMPKNAQAFSTASLFGIYCDDYAGAAFVNIETNAAGSRFVFATGSASARGSFVPNFYDNNIWNFAIRMRPHQATITNNTIHDYELNLLAYSFDTDSSYRAHTGSFVLSKNTAEGFLTGRKNIYIGAIDANYPSNVKVLNVRYWKTYLEDDVIATHAKDITNYGTNDAIENIKSIESAVLRWDFESVTGSDNNGRFIVQDLVNTYDGTGVGFSVNSTSFIRKEDLKTYKTLNFDTLRGIETIQTLDEDDQTIRNLQKKPAGLKLLVENSMYQVISEDMINIFASAGEYMFSFAGGGERYSDRYTRLDAIRNKYFSKIISPPDLEKYLNFYKWLDSALGAMIDQLKPESTGGTSGLKNTVESHMLERNKFEHKLPLTTPVNASNAYGNDIQTIRVVREVGSSLSPQRGDLTGVTRKYISSFSPEPIVSVENKKDVNYFKNYEIVGGAGKAINHRDGKSGKSIFRTNFSSGDGLSDLNRLANTQGETSIYNSLLNKSADDRALLNYSSSLSTDIQREYRPFNVTRAQIYLTNTNIYIEKYIDVRVGDLFLVTESIKDPTGKVFVTPGVKTIKYVFNNSPDDTVLTIASDNFEFTFVEQVSGTIYLYKNADNTFFQRNIPHTASNYTNINNISYEAFPQNSILEFRKYNILGGQENGLAKYIREPPVEFNISVEHELRVEGALEDIQVVSPYGSKIYKLANSGTESYIPESKPVSDADTFYKTADTLPAIEIKRAEHLEYIFPKRKLLGLSETRTKSLYPEVSGTFDAEQAVWSADSYNRNSAGIRSFWRDSVLERRRTRGIDVEVDIGNKILPVGSINCAGEYNIGAYSGNTWPLGDKIIVTVLSERTGSNRYPFIKDETRKYFINFTTSFIRNSYNSIYSMDSILEILYAGSVT